MYRYRKIIIFVIIIGAISLAVFYSFKNYENRKFRESFSRTYGLSISDVSFLDEAGFIDRKEVKTREKLGVFKLKSLNLIEQKLVSDDESFEVLATKLDLKQNNYKLAFKLENKSVQQKEFYLIPVFEKEQLEFKEIKGILKGEKVENGEHLSAKSGEVFSVASLSELYDVEKHKQELKPELAQAYDDIENNNYEAKPIKIVLEPRADLTAVAEWDIKNPKSAPNPNSQFPIPNSNLKPVYFLVYGSAGGVKDELTILNVHSHPQQGENWTVSFETKGTADLTITPQDQATIDDDEFVSLSCDGETRTPQILQGDIIFYPNWQCDGEGKVVHYTKKAGRHTLKFQFGDQTDYAYNSTVTWDGSDSAVWTLDANWVGGVAPTSTDDVIIDGNGTYAPVISGNVTVNSLAIGQTTASTLSFTAGTAADLTVTGTLTVYANGTITVTASDSDGTPTNGTGRTITAANIDIQTGGSLEADGLGFAGGSGNGVDGTGPGKGLAGSSGAGYGGAGGKSEETSTAGGSPYGTASSPVALGSGGGTRTGASGTGGSGGGAIKLSVSGTLTINGTLSANGTNGATYAAGGSGGSIWITGGLLKGTGTISANGGNAANKGGGGGGGRIDISGITVAGSTFLTGGGSLSVTGGNMAFHAQPGGAGTIKFPASFDLVIDNSGATGLKNLTLGVNVESSAVDETLYNFNSVTVAANSILTLSGNHQIENGGSTGNEYGQGVTITAANMTITGTVSANGTGFAGGASSNRAGLGPGKGLVGSSGGSGAGYGGVGGASGDGTAGGSAYGSITNPINLGSGGGVIASGASGPGGSGGGAIKLSISGTLTVNGTLSANGTNGAGYAGGGSGGSVYLDVDTLAGTGTISSKGGNGHTNSGGGGGGRVALYYTTSYSITPTATGGTGTYVGGPGTVFFSKVSGSPKKVTGAATPSDPTSWYGQDGWLYRKKITIDNTNVDSDLTNFPLYVFVEGTGSGSSLASKIQDSGQDLRFTDSSGVRTLPHEIESYSEASGNVTAYVWVKVPTVNGSSDTNIYMYYGNSGASDGQDAANVWDTNYKGVWHLEETVTDEGTAANVHIDSTSNANHGDQKGNDDAAGKIFNAQDFDGTNDYVDAGSGNPVGAGNDVSISVWIKPDTGNTNDGVVNRWVNDKGFILFMFSDGTQISWQIDSGANGRATSTTNSVPVGQWTHVGATFEQALASNELKVFINGTLNAQTNSNGTNQNAAANQLIGQYSGGQFFDGLIDEVRISNTARSADWIKFEYNNMSQADNELSWGSEGTSSFTRTKGGIRTR